MRSDLMYAVKVHMATGIINTGPYQTKEEANSLAADIAFGDVNTFDTLNTFDTQRKGRAYLSELPNYVEVIPFVPKEYRYDDA